VFGKPWAAYSGTMLTTWRDDIADYGAHLAASKHQSVAGNIGLGHGANARRHARENIYRDGVSDFAAALISRDAAT